MQHKRPFKVVIADDKVTSIATDPEGKEHLKVCSDGSAQDSKVGSAVVLICPGKETRKLHSHLGSVNHHMVFEAKLVGLLLGLYLIKMEKLRTSYTLVADNIAVLTAVKTPGNKSGHYLADTFIKTACSLHKARCTPNYSLMMRWTAGVLGMTMSALTRAMSI